jgi:protein-L-isoaspartate(D-aspartate) O-methyltransferase
MLASSKAIEDYRHHYSQEIRFVANVETPGLVDAFARVPREKFAGPGPWRIASAEKRMMSAAGLGASSYTTIEDARDLYHNVVVVLDASKDINNGQPGALALWMDALDLKPGGRVYHMGCGAGYYTAMMAEVVGSEGSVVACEYQPELAERARENLSCYPNVTVHAGDGAAFDPGDCDAMLINAGVTRLHPLWLDRLRENGRLVVPFTIGMSPTLGQGIMAKIVRERGAYSAQFVSPLGIYSCTGLRDPESEALLKKALISGALIKLKSLRRDEHEAVDTCLVHVPGMCISALDAIAQGGGDA